ncbi:MAG: ABC transporter substrate-binding protein [Hyphomicrobiaceae bacterium]
MVKIGLLTDMSGPYSDLSGSGAETAVRMAIEDFGGKVLDKPIELVVADHQNKADIGAGIARKWYDAENVDMIIDLTNSAVALATVSLAKSSNKIAIAVGPATTRLTNDSCTPNSVHYAFDSFAWAHVTGNALIRNGGNSWFFLTVDYAAGYAMEKDTSDVVRKAGGKVLGSVRVPTGASDFSSYLMTAKASGANVIGLANSGADTINSVKQAGEFGITRDGKVRLAALGMYIADVHSLGLKAAQGLVYTEAFYWDHTDETRKWSKRFFEKTNRMPTQTQAGDYSATLHYLKAVQAAGTDAAGEVMQKMRETPINDMFAKDGKIRIDGRMVHDMYLVQVKRPDDSKYPWDYLEVIETVPGDQAFQPLSLSTCPLVKN